MHQVRGNSSSQGVDVRPCIAADVAALTADEPPDARLAEHFFARQQTGEVVYLIGWLDGDPVGTGVLATGDPTELKNLHVREPYRRRGIGAEIVAAAERIVGTGELVIGVSVDNPDARRLYERLGYRPTGRLKTATYHYVDADGVQREATETAEDLEKVVSIGSLDTRSAGTRSDKRTGKSSTLENGPSG